MSRGLGGALTLSVLAHGGAVATIGVVGAAWLAGPPPAPAAGALYVDLVHPVVATSDRHEAADGSALRRADRAGPGLPSARRSTRAVRRGAADGRRRWPRRCALRGRRLPRTPASAAPEVPRPPAAPVCARVDRRRSRVDRHRSRRRSRPPAAAPPASATGGRQPMALPPTETVAPRPTGDTGTSAPPDARRRTPATPSRRETSSTAARRRWRPR